MSERRWDVPESWAWASAEQISEIVGGGTPSTSDPTNFSKDGVPWLTPADLTGYRETYIAKGRRDLSDKGLRSSGATLMPAGTVLFSSRAPVGYCAIAANEISTNQGFKSFVLKGDMFPEYVRHYLLGSAEYAESLASGTTFKELSGARAAQLAIPIAPLSEQRRIPLLIGHYKHAILEKAFTGELTADWRQEGAAGKPVVPRAEESMKKKYRLAGRAEFNPPYAIPAAWRWLRLPQLGELDRGKSKHRPRNDPSLYGGEYPFIQMGEVRQADRYLRNYETTYSDKGLAQSRLWPIGTVCITIAANIAETAILDIDACFPDSVVGFIGDADKVLSAYVEFFVRTTKEELEAFAPATAQKNINLDTLVRRRIQRMHDRCT